MRKNTRQLLTLSILLLAAGCGSSDKAAYMSLAQPPTPGTKLAIEHEVDIDVPEDSIEQAHQSALDACRKDIANRCTVLESTLNRGHYGSARLRVRILPAGVDPLVAVAKEFGEIERRSTHAEDLAKPIADADKRIAMLEAYLKDLLALRQQSRHEVDALIRVAGEIAKTQSELDAAKADQAQLNQRVDLQLLRIDYNSERRESFWAPIGLALTEFRQNLGSGIAGAISGVAFVLPWLVLLVALFYGLRWLWRRRR